MLWLWSGFILFVLAMLALDLGVLNRKAHVVRTREALLWSGFCAFLALGFSVLVYFIYEWRWFDIQDSTGERLSGYSASIQFLTGWIIEQSLSLDNIFVIAMIFSYFGVPLQHQHRTLFWGILGALVMRLAMIMLGAMLIARFHWVIYVFGALLLLTAYKLWRSSEEKVEPDKNPLVRLARRFYPVTSQFEGDKFFSRIDGRRAVTPLFLTLLAIESTDVIFAIDSIPAIFAVTRDPFIVFTSNVFAILNLRSLYFALADLLDRFRKLKHSLIIVLAYVGAKMLVTDLIDIHVGVTLGVVLVVLLAGVLASWRDAPRSETHTTVSKPRRQERQDAKESRN